MWDWRQLRWLNYFGWWPWLASTRSRFLWYKSIVHELEERLSTFMEKRLEFLEKCLEFLVPQLSVANIFWSIINELYCGYLIYVADFVQMGPEITSILQGMRDGSLAPVVLNINQTSLGIMWAVKVWNLFNKRPKVQGIMQKFHELDTRGRELIGDKAVDKFTKYWEFRCMVTVMYIPVALMVTMLWIIRPIVYLCMGHRVHILDAWTPFDSTTALGWLSVYLLQTVHVFTAIWGLIMADSLIFCFLEMLKLQYDILKRALETLDLGHKTNKVLDKSILFHQEILRLGREINDVVKYIIPFQCVVSTIVICLSIFEFSKSDGTAMKRLNNLLVGSGMVIMSLMYSWLCQELQGENTEVIRAAYRSKWYEATLDERRKLNFLMTRSQKPQLFGKIIVADTDFFIMVLKTSFSYYQFLATLAN